MAASHSLMIFTHVLAQPTSMLHLIDNCFFGNDQLKKKIWCKRWLETQVIWFLTPSPGLEDSSWGITLQNTWLRGRISGEKFRTCKGYHPLLELHLSGTAQTLVSLCCTFNVTRALCLLLRRGIITWKDCESIPVEKVDMTIVPMAIRKLWKQKSKEDFEKNELHRVLKSTERLMLNLTSIVVQSALLFTCFCTLHFS